MTSAPIRLILAGATGFAGNAVLHQALADPAIARVTVLTRRVLDMSHPKLKQVRVDDFTDYSAIADDDLTADACIWCLGVSQTAVGKEAYVRITVEYALAGAQAMLARNPALRFCFLSGSRADQQERSKVYYGRIKGRTERLLSGLTPDAFHFRPAMIREPGGAVRPPLVARLLVPLALLLDRFSEQVSVECRQLAACMLDVAKHGHGLHVWPNREIRRWEASA
jgi:uncharacterized protein YbjT (DUF2867 family)